MKPLLHPSSIFFFCFTLFISINIQTSLCQDDDQYTNCNKAFTCKDSIQDLKYPFWGGNRHEYCGEHGLELTCEDSVPKITINSINYRILDWEFSTQKLTVARDDYWGGICAVSDYKNDSFNNTPFQYYDAALYNVTLLYNCASNDIPRTLLRSDCDDGSRVVYYVVGPFYLGICTSAVIPILGPQASKLVSENKIDEALKEGFGLKWSGNYEECKTCMDSDGECGWYDGGGFRCFCKDGPHTSSCQSQKAPISNRNVADKSSPSQVPIGIGIATLSSIIGCVCFKFVVQRRRKITEQSRSKDLPMPTSSMVTLTSVTNLSQSVASYPSSKSDTLQSSSYFGVQLFTYAELEKATKKFHISSKLGEGGFGTVYKGKLNDGRVVAVKRHHESNLDEVKRVDQFMNEVKILAGLRHKNLVRLFGCSIGHSKELLLVYELIPNGTVADRLHINPTKSTFLPWLVRLNIAVEIAEALAYLHANGVIHRDVKSNNILLDDKFNAKLADFGLSRSFPNNVTHVSTAPLGTPGYIDPEYYNCCHLSDKSDVYSFGVVLVELLSSLYAVDYRRNGVLLSNMAVNKILNQELHELVDPYFGFEIDCAVKQMTTEVAVLAFRCLQQHRDLRPSMDEVLEILRGIKSDELDTREGKQK